MVFWYTIVLLPLVAHGLARVEATQTRVARNKPPSQPTKSSSRGKVQRSASSKPASPSVVQVQAPVSTRPMLIGASLVLLAWFCLIQPPIRTWVPSHIWLGLPTVDLPGAPGTYRNETPVAASIYLQEHPRSGRIFNDSGIGSYLIWAMGTSQPVFIDPRVELFPLELWQDYQDIAAATNYNDLLITKYNITRLIINRNDQSRLMEALRDDPRWAREYVDREVAIYYRVDPPSP
jgi:hypothetical protein